MGSFQTHLKAGSAAFAPSATDVRQLVAFLRTIDDDTVPFTLPADQDLCPATVPAN